MKNIPGADSEMLFPVSTMVKKMTSVQRALCQVSARSKFRENVWDFQDEYPSSPRCDVKFRFDLKLKSGSLCDGKHNLLVDSLKCLVYSLLFDPPHPKLGISTLAKAMCPGHGIWHIYVFIADQNLTGLSEFTKDGFSDLLRVICEPGKCLKVTDRTLMSRVRGIDWIGMQADKLDDRLPFVPWEDHRAAGVWARNNAQALCVRGTLVTQPWSDALVEAMVGVALKIISKASEVEEMFATDKPGTSAKKTSYTHLRSAVGLLTAMFSGMRMKEVVSMSSDLKKCISVQEVQQSDRVIRGVFLHSYKSKKSVALSDTWQTIPIVHDAIKSLSRIDNLLSVDYAYLLHPARFSSERDSGRRLAVQVFMNALNEMARDYSVDLSEVNGRISSLDFRRTFARLVTRNGLNVLELQSQLKHVEPSLSMQYGAPALREHLLTEQQNFTRDQYRELIDGGEKLIGGGAREIKDMRVYFVGLTRAEKKDFLESLPKEALIDQMADGLCRYRPHLALCGGDKLACRPADCTNSIILANDFEKTVSFRVEENTRLLKIFAKKPAKREHLKEQLSVLKKLRDQLEEP